MKISAPVPPKLIQVPVTVDTNLTINFGAPAAGDAYREAGDVDKEADDTLRDGGDASWNADETALEPGDEGPEGGDLVAVEAVDVAQEAGDTMVRIAEPVG